VNDFLGLSLALGNAWEWVVLRIALALALRRENSASRVQ
jgi:hypothetical protein